MKSGRMHPSLLPHLVLNSGANLLNRETASLYSTSLPHCRYTYNPFVPTCTVSASLASAPKSHWLIRTIRLGYVIQFARHPTKFRGIHFTSVKAVDAHVLQAEIAVLLAKEAVETVPPVDMRSGFYSPNKTGGLRLILDL